MGRKLYPDKQHIIEVVDGLYQLGLRSVVVCPGSRSAPLTLAFARYGRFQICTVIDERSAAYVALGQAIATCGLTAVALVCTSGTALLNMGPAVAEAYYLRLPLLVLSADRPAISIDQLDGQTIRQEKVFEAHTVFSGSLTEHGYTKIDLKRSKKVMHDAWSAMMDQQGPAHLNVPLHEPLYELPPITTRLIHDQGTSEGDENSIGALPGALTTTRKMPVSDECPKSEAALFGGVETSLISNLRDTIRHASRILLVPGQSAPDARLDGVVKLWLQDPRVVALIEPVSNLLNGEQSMFGDRRSSVETLGLVYRHDDLLVPDNPNIRGLRPDVIISWGLQIVGKRTRNWLRRQSAMNERNPIGLSRPRHFRLDAVGWAADPYHNPPDVIRVSPFEALQAVSDAVNWDKNRVPANDKHQKITQKSPDWVSLDIEPTRTYQEHWQALEQKAEDVLAPLLKFLPFGDLAVIQELGRHISADHAVHLGNSMPIRYWQMLGGGVQSWWIHANRGTSGIDGVNSTALGFSLSEPDRTVWLITGDLSFVYDINAFSCQKRPENLRIVVINNQGGDIFRLIEGPSRQPECEDLFATPRRVDLLALAAAWGCDTYRATTAFELSTVLGQLDSRSEGRGPAVVEVVTEPKSNQIVYQSYQKALLTPL